MRNVRAAMQMGTTRMRVASEVWVQAVTEAALTEGIVWGIVLSSVFAMVSVYVFTGSAAVMALAAATMVCINILVLGLYHAMGWRLGAIEGVSITVLVGLSVDFAIHFSEAFVRSRLIGRRERAQCAPLSLRLASPPPPPLPPQPTPFSAQYPQPQPVASHTQARSPKSENRWLTGYDIPNPLPSLWPFTCLRAAPTCAVKACMHLLFGAALIMAASLVPHDLSTWQRAPAAMHEVPIAPRRRVVARLPLADLQALLDHGVRRCAMALRHQTPPKCIQN